MTEVTLLNYGAGNLASVAFAFERLGASVRTTDDPAAVADAERLVVPGVGAAAYAMSRLRDLDLVAPLRAFPRPLLGVCLGQQLLFETSAEGETELLGLIPGRVEPIRATAERPAPHMGWSRLSRDRDDPMLEGVADGAWGYFVHGYVCPMGADTLAHADYGDPVPAVVRKGQRWGCQFHPERSSATGARLLRNFLELPA